MIGTTPQTYPLCLLELLGSEHLMVENTHQTLDCDIDLSTRVIRLPNSTQNLPSFVANAFLAHEIGHALFTPVDWLLNSEGIEINRKAMNIVEDSRVERLMRKDYPELEYDFSLAYPYLHSKGWFGKVRKVLSFPARLNQFLKCGPSPEVEFEDDERALLDSAVKTETLDEAQKVAIDIEDYCREKNIKI